MMEEELIEMAPKEEEITMNTGGKNEEIIRKF